MHSFQTLINSFDSDNLKRGKEFERFVKWFLVHDPEWSSRVDKVWLWDDWPENWGRDCGIDLIFKEKITGEIWAVQAKCYDPNYAITKKDVDSFLSESSRPQIDKRLLIATTDIIGPNASKVCNETDKQVVRYLLHNFEESAIDYPKNLLELASSKVADVPKPRKYQEEAIKNVITGFKYSDRGQLIMACGTGKTLTTLWIKEELKSKTTLVLLPSLNLVSQTLKEWTAKKNTYFSVLCVCSDTNIGNIQYDEIIGKVEDLSFPSTSDSNEILKFLEYSGDKVIFSTYQSSPLIAEAQKKSSVQFDLVVADEAHRCTGELNKPFTTVLDQSKIKAHKRLFTTATPRTYSANLKKRAHERGIEVSGMDNESLFGSVFHTLNFASAINNKPQLLTDYQVVIVGVDQPMIAQWIKDREFVRTSKGETTNAKDLAAQLGLIKAIKDYDLNRLISFHSRVKKAGNFSVEIQDAIDIVDHGYRPKGQVWSDFVSGEMTTRSRNTKLKQLKELSNSQIGILSNARCLSEGVDVPSLDGVAFIDPKRSQVDIIQAVGRAIRLSDHKTIGTIVLPVFIEQDDDEIESIQSSNFKPIWDVINALRSHDEELSLELDQLRTQMGSEATSEVRNISDKIIFDIPETVDSSFSQSLMTKIVEQITSSWNFSFGSLLKYYEVHGHLNIPRDFKTNDGNLLSKWVRRQRAFKNKGSLSKDRIQKLESVPEWSWNPIQENWNKMFDYLNEYVSVHGDARVNARYKTSDGSRLGGWVGHQRKSMSNGSLSKDQIKQLESLPGWSWDINDDDWNKGFDHLNDYVALHGDALVPNNFETSDGYPLGKWVQSQRYKMRKIKSGKEFRGVLGKNRIKQLESLPGWSWDIVEDLWNQGFDYLKNYIEVHGDSRVSSRFITSDGYPLGSWVSHQRITKISAVITEEHIQKLESLPYWSWDPYTDNWNRAFNYLNEYVLVYRDLKMSQGYQTSDGFSLGSWVTHQRQHKKKGTLGEDKIQKLESIPGWSWDPIEDQWNKSFQYLKEYVKSYGNSKVHQNYINSAGFKLGAWVNTQKVNNTKGKLREDRIQKLQSVQGWTWSLAKKDNWDKGFDYLYAYVKKYGNASVPDKYKLPDGFALFNWVSRQRRTISKLSNDRIHKLEALSGWSWDPRKDRWNKAFELLKQYVEDNGKVIISTKYKTSEGFNLGIWVRDQKAKQIKGALDEFQIESLESLAGWKWREE
jgi:superfamily II DNA or RNA helicase